MTQTNLPQRAQPNRMERINESINKEIAADILVREGGLILQSVAECMEVAKMMSISDTAVPPHLRGNPGACLAICIYAMEWTMSPFAVANKSYVVNDRLSFESQLIHAVVERRAPLAGRLRHSLSGEGDGLVCTVTGKMKGEDEPFELESPPLGKIHPKNSPLWKTKPGIQLFYNTVRDWARVYCPDVILGIYSDEEMQNAVTDAAASHQAAPVTDGAPQTDAKSGVQKVKARLSKGKTPTLPPIEQQQQQQEPEKTADEPEPSPVVDKPSPAAATAPQADAATQQQGAAPGASDQGGMKLDEPEEEAPTEEEADFTNFEGFVQAMNKLCERRRVPNQKCADVLKAKISAIGKKNRHNEIKLPTLIGWYQQAQAGEGLFDIFQTK